jgi:hypothetical protein
MRRRLLAACLLVLGAGPAGAVTPEEVAEESRLRRYYIETGSPISINEMEGLVREHTGLYFIALASTPPEGADLFAARVADLLSQGTVVAITPDEIGAVSFDHDDATLQGALDRVTGESYLVDLAAFAGALEGSPLVPLLVLAAVAVAVVLAVYALRAGNRRARERRLEEARAEIRVQMGVIADQILHFSDRPAAEENREAMTHFRAASGLYDAAEGRLASASSLAELERLSDDLDLARWELEAAEALLAGRGLPPKPEADKPEACFFDPTHGAGVEEAELRTPAGPRKVLVCRADAERLRGGDAPEARRIPVGRRSLPAPRAPRGYGGRGMDWLDVFSILVGGMGQGRSYDWRPPQRRLPGGISLPARRTVRRVSGRARRSR